MDRRGLRLVIELGIVAMAAGLLLAPLARTPWQLYLSLGALVGGGVNCLAYTGQSLNLTRWFVVRRGLALSQPSQAWASAPSSCSRGCNR
jgi:hypothetical protein